MVFECLRTLTSSSRSYKRFCVVAHPGESTLPVLFTAESTNDFVSFVESQFEVTGSWFSPFSNLNISLELKLNSK